MTSMGFLHYRLKYNLSDESGCAECSAPYILWGKTDNSDKSLLFYQADRGFSGNPYEMGRIDRTYSMDSLPREYSCFGTGDYRITSFKVQNKDGSQAVELCYTEYFVKKENM